MHRLAVPLFVAAFLAPLAQAQNCGLRNSARLAHAVCDSGAGSETRFDTGVVSAGPLVSSTSVSPSNVCGCHSDLVVMITSDYGSLSYHATASGNSCSCCGIFMWIDQGDSGSKARFFDRLTVISTSLPAGTPVTIRANLSLVGGQSASNANTENSFSAQLDLMGNIGGNLFVTDSQGTTSQQFTLGVGQAFDINAQLFSVLRDYVLLGLNQAGAFGSNLDAVVWFDVLTPGASLSSCSGHDYSPQVFCPADLDNGSGTGVRDGAVDINDLLFFLTQFEIGAGVVDLDNGSGTGTPDGGVDINDLLFFLTRFEAGC